MSTINIGGNEVPTLAVAVAIPVVAALYVAYAGYFAEESLTARQTAIVAMEAEVEEKKGQVESLMQRAKDFDKIREEIAGFEKKITLLRSRIPADAQIPVLLYDVERMAKASGSEVQTFEPAEVKAFQLPSSSGADGAADAGATEGASATGGDIFEVPIKVTAMSTYPQLINFFTQLNRYERKLSVSGVSIAQKEAPKVRAKEALLLGQPYRNSLQVEFVVSAYVLKQGGVVE